MKTYIVTWKEVLITTYEVEAEDEEDAIDAVRGGEGFEIARDAEPLSDDDAVTAVEKVER